MKLGRDEARLLLHEDRVIAGRLQAPWINALSDGLSNKDLQIVHRVVVALREKLESNGRENQD